MDSLIEALAQQLNGSELRDMSRELNADPSTTGAALSAALPVILQALNRNASQPSGAESLSNALRQDHDGAILNDLSGFFPRAQQGPGDGILRHVLGARRPAVETAVSKKSGMDRQQVAQLLTMLAPVILGMLGKRMREKNLDSGGLSNYLDEETRQIRQSSAKSPSLLGQLLDQDGDGDFDLGDVAKGVMGRLFR